MIRRELPVSVDIGSETYKIDADFRTIMNVEGIIFGKEVCRRNDERDRY